MERLWRYSWNDDLLQKKTYCIICGERKSGIEVINDPVLEGIRWFKKNITRNEQGNSLVVCRGCYPNYSKARSRYEGRQRRYMALGALFVVFSLLLSQTLPTLLISLGVFLLLYLLSLLSYMPRISIKRQHNQ